MNISFTGKYHVFSKGFISSFTFSSNSKSLVLIRIDSCPLIIFNAMYWDFIEPYIFLNQFYNCGDLPLIIESDSEFNIEYVLTHGAHERKDQFDFIQIGYNLPNKMADIDEGEIVFHSPTLRRNNKLAMANNTFSYLTGKLI